MRTRRLTAILLVCGAVLVGALALVHYTATAWAQETGTQPIAPVVGDQVKPAKPLAPRDPAARQQLRDQLAERMKERMKDPAIRERLRATRDLGAAPAIAVADGAVFVVKGNTIYKFSADNLQLIAKTQLEELPERPMVLKTPKAAPEKAP